MLKPFAKRWLQLIASLHIIGGLLLPWLLHADLSAMYRQEVFQALSVPEAAQNTVVLMMSFIGPTIASWGVLLLYLINNAFDQGDKSAWSYLCIAILVWAPLDIGLSWHAGIYSNIAVDVMATLSILLPVWLIRHPIKPDPP